MLLAIGYALTDCTDDVTGFADANADLTPLIANDNNGTKAKFFTAFDHFGDPTDLNNAFLPIGLFFLCSSAFPTICHNFSLLL